MNYKSSLAILLAITASCLSLSAQNYKADRLRRAVNKLELSIVADSLLPDTTLSLIAKDGRTVYIRTSPQCEVEHVGIPLFNDMMRLLQPSPVYDFLEYALLNWKYKIDSNLLYLSKVIFKTGSWKTLLQSRINDCECSIENRDDKLYIVTWKRNDQDVAVIGIPIEYELLNNDTRRNMERAVVSQLQAFDTDVIRPLRTVGEDELSIYGTEGLFVVPGKSYIIDLLNQNVYYMLTTVYETADTIIGNKPVRMNMEAILPVIARDMEFPAETFANLMMCDDNSIPDVTMELDFHLSDYHRQTVTMPISRLRAYFRQQGCNLFFAYDGMKDDVLRGVMFASNLPKGYNHLFSLRTTKDMLMAAVPSIHADVYLYIPPISKEKLFGTAPTKKSSANFKLP